ncbi:zinc finger BED domain-containing protein 1-like protein, partial [Aphelenchoides avenae]
MTVKEALQKAEKYSAGSKRKLEIDNAVAMALTIPSCSINFFRHPLVIHLFNVLDPRYELPTSYNGLKGLLSMPFNRTKKAVQELIRNLKYRPSVITDIWTTKNCKNSYMGVSLRFVTNDSKHVSYALLDLVELQQSKTAVYVLDALTTILAEYGLDVDDVYKFVTDNGSNYVSAFREPDQVYYLYGDSTEVVDDNNVEESENEEFEYTLDLQRRLPCAAHMLQNVMKDALLKNLEGQEAFKALKSLITSFRKSDATGMLN